MNKLRNPQFGDLPPIVVKNYVLPYDCFVEGGLSKEKIMEEMLRKRRRPC